jgi:hypothetical protein
MQAMQGDWLPARAALHPTGLYFSLREIRPAELQDPFMQETIARVPARETVVQVAREDVGKGAATSRAAARRSCRSFSSSTSASSSTPSRCR